MSSEKQSLKEIINFRLQKLEKLREYGIDPFPHNFKNSNYSIELNVVTVDLCLLQGDRTKLYSLLFFYLPNFVFFISCSYCELINLVCI